ncbi:MAG: ribonuclease HI [Alphaproteobacteria bacterium]|jgi:ribonuclease HI|nr:ribonuclease HI [Alphaproteobacteria bacterium]MBQ8659991.1 ribonuclease HI [Alphaproteobacteria bacterium]MBR4315557.1 ribonuclease HI [Alphaproteobacteria bacterium]
MNDKIIIYTDGACSGNPGAGGWGALVIEPTGETELYDGERLTTNNKMELTAVIKALEFIGDTKLPVELWTDSQYVKNGITDWIKGWKKNGWRNSQKQPVKNKELWEKLDELSSKFDISWNWVKGHNGHPENERVDELARRGISELV